MFSTSMPTADARNDGVRARIAPRFRIGEGVIVRRAVAAGLGMLVAFGPLSAAAAPACQAPESWPLGNHEGEIALSGNRRVTTQGWDPAFFPEKGHQPLKDALTSGVRTYEVGLPGTAEPSDLKPWTGSCDWTNAALEEAGMPKISLTAESGTGRINDVYLVKGYNVQGCTVYLEAGVKVAVWGSAFKDIRTNAPSAGVWIVDSLIDQDPGEKGAFRGGETNATCKTHVMYSEQMGGLDVGKTHNMTYYRNHLHGSMKIDDGHADGLQINANSDCAFIYENNVEFLFRMTNRPLFLQNSNPGGIHNTWIVNNLISGGANCIDLCGKTSDNAPRFGPCTNTIVCGNRCLGADDNVSWANPTPDTTSSAAVLNQGDGVSGYHYRENNGFLAGTVHKTSVLDSEGDRQTFASTPAVPAQNKGEVDRRIALLETWTSEIRSAAGGSPSPPTQGTPPAAPTLLPN